MKKAELSMSFLIVSILGILILVVVTYLVMTSFGGVTTTAGCAQAGGSCVDNCNPDSYLGGGISQAQELCEGNGQAIAGGSGQYCCAVGGESSNN